MCCLTSESEDCVGELLMRLSTRDWMAESLASQGRPGGGLPSAHRARFPTAADNPRICRFWARARAPDSAPRCAPQCPWPTRSPQAARPTWREGEGFVSWWRLLDAYCAEFRAKKQAGERAADRRRWTTYTCRW